MPPRRFYNTPILFSRLCRANVKYRLRAVVWSLEKATWKTDRLFK